MESRGPQDPTDSRHSPHLLKLWTEEPRAAFGPSMDGWRGETAEEELHHRWSGWHPRALYSLERGLQTAWLPLNPFRTWEPAGGPRGRLSFLPSPAGAVSLSSSQNQASWVLSQEAALPSCEVLGKPQALPFLGLSFSFCKTEMVLVHTPQVGVST